LLVYPAPRLTSSFQDRYTTPCPGCPSAAELRVLKAQGALFQGTPWCSCPICTTPSRMNRRCSL